MFAIIQTGGKQYVVKPGDRLTIEKIEGEPGAVLQFDKVLFKAEGENVDVGKPYVPKTSVKAEILKQSRGEKLTVWKFKSKTRYRKKQGYRTPKTEIRILEISN